MLLGTVQFGIAAMLSHDSLWPMILTMLVSNLISLTGVFAGSQIKTDNNEDLIFPEPELLAD